MKMIVEKKVKSWLPDFQRKMLGKIELWRIKVDEIMNYLNVFAKIISNNKMQKLRKTIVLSVISVAITMKH